MSPASRHTYEGNCRNTAFAPGVGQRKQSDSRHELWVVVKSCKTAYGGKGVKVTQGDIIRMGRMMLRVKKGLAADNPDGLCLNPSSRVMDGPTSDNGNAICRICLSETQSPDNPFISPCHCDGTMKYIHLLCLREWLKSKIVVKTNESVVSYHWKPLSCELCKVEFPDSIVLNEQAISLIKLPDLEAPHIIFEEVRKGLRPTKAFHIVSILNNQVVKLGRGHECDVRIPDISVSRYHAFLKVFDGELYLEDRASKFGTLVLNQSPLTLVPGLGISIQVDRTLLDLHASRLSKLRGWCLRCCFRAEPTIEEEEIEAELQSVPDHLEESRSEQSSSSNIVENDIHPEDLEVPVPYEEGQPVLISEPNAQAIGPVEE